MTVVLSTHAAMRTQQRGVPHRLIDALMNYADFEAPVGGGCTVLRMTRDRLDDADLADRLGAERERLRGLSRAEPLLEFRGLRDAQPRGAVHHPAVIRV
jgi:hypothetical protein